MKQTVQFKIISILLIIAALILSTVFTSGTKFQIRADEIDEVQQEIDSQNSKLEQIRQDLEDSRKQLENLSSIRNSYYGELSSARADLNLIKSRLADNTAGIEKLDEDIGRINSLITRRVDQRNRKLQNIYFDLQIPLITEILKIKNINSFSKLWKYKEAGIRSDRENLNILNSQLSQLQSNLSQSRQLQEELSAMNEQIENNIASINQQIAGLNNQISYEQQRQSAMSGEMSEIQGNIEKLTAYQEELIRQKLLATQFNTSVGSIEQGIEALESPGFADGFVFFTYGYPHRVGMNQYGAYGRAKAGQPAEQILNAYYSGIKIDKDFETPETIPVQGYGDVDFQEYLKGLGEMPSCWDIEALKAQVIAARTYALNYIYYSWNGTEFTEKSPNPICTTQACQVYLGRPKGGECAENWYRAVEETENWVITYKNKPITAWYASTAGGYARSAQSVWGGYRPWALGMKDFDSGGNAFDGPNWGNSPWYHKSWGETSRGNPWLTNEETQDLFNALLLSEYSSDYNQFLTQPDKGGWSMDKIKEELQKLDISPVGKISAISTVDDGTGYIESVIIDSEGYGLKSFDGYQFRSMFNLRSLGTLVIWTSRFDVQKG